MKKLGIYAVSIRKEIQIKGSRLIEVSAEAGITGQWTMVPGTFTCPVFKSDRPMSIK